MQLDSRSIGRARRGATNAAEIGGIPCWYSVSLGFPALSVAVGAADQQEHSLPTQHSAEKDSAWLLATLRNSLIQERETAISPTAG
jgi:hypothetical protein